MLRNYLLGRRFDLRTNHMNLNYFFDQPCLNARKPIWIEFLCEFYFEIKHVKGKENKVADAPRIKFHVEALTVCKSYLGTRVFEAPKR